MYALGCCTDCWLGAQGPENQRTSYREIAARDCSNDDRQPSDKLLYHTDCSVVVDALRRRYIGRSDEEMRTGRPAS